MNINSDLKNSINDNLKQIKQLILFQQHKLSLLNKHNVLGLISWNPDFEITDWDDTASDIFGYTKQEAIGCHAAELLVPETVREQLQIMVLAYQKKSNIDYSTLFIQPNLLAKVLVWDYQSAIK